MRVFEEGGREGKKKGGREGGREGERACTYPTSATRMACSTVATTSRVSVVPMV